MLDRYPVKRPEMAWRVYDGQAVILCPDDSTLNTLNVVGTLIWELADGQTPLSVIVGQICSEFDVEPAQAEKDAHAFVDNLCRRGLLTVSESAHPGA